MRDCEDLSAIRQVDVDDMVGKAPHEDPPDISAGDARHRRSRARCSLDPVDDSPDRSEKVESKTGPFLVVPTRRRGHLGLRLGTDPDTALQLLLRLRFSRSRTSGQGLPGSSPDRARAARSSISVTHALSASGSASASRLAISSDASSARSAGPSFKASWRSLLVAFVTERSLARPSSPNKALQRTGEQAPHGWQSAVLAGRSAPDR